MIKRLTKRFLLRVARDISLRVLKKTAYFSSNHKIVSFAFDDFPLTAITNGARILESYDLYGTFYASLGISGRDSNCGRLGTLENMLSLAHHGHELACHTYSHLSCAFQSPSLIRSECLQNQIIAKITSNIHLQSFSYPWGNIDPLCKYVISKIYNTARTVVHGINVNNIDLAALKSVDLTDRNGLVKILEWLDRLCDSGGWLIFTTHDVSETPSPYGSSIKLFERVLEICIKNNFRIMTVSNATSLCTYNNSKQYQAPSPKP